MIVSRVSRHPYYSCRNISEPAVGDRYGSCNFQSTPLRFLVTCKFGTKSYIFQGKRVILRVQSEMIANRLAKPEQRRLNSLGGSVEPCIVQCGTVIEYSKSSHLQ